MRQGKNPTREQKKLLVKRKLNPADWLVVQDLPWELKLVHRHFDKTVKTVPKGGRES